MTVWLSELIQAVGIDAELGALTEVADFGERLREVPGGLRVGSAFLVNKAFRLVYPLQPFFLPDLGL